MWIFKVLCKKKFSKQKGPVLNKLHLQMLFVDTQAACCWKRSKCCNKLLTENSLCVVLLCDPRMSYINLPHLVYILSYIILSYLILHVSYLKLILSLSFHLIILYLMASYLIHLRCYILSYLILSFLISSCIMSYILGLGVVLIVGFSQNSAGSGLCMVSANNLDLNCSGQT